MDVAAACLEAICNKLDYREHFAVGWGVDPAPAATAPCMQVFEQADMLVMLYQGDHGTTACTVPVKPLNSLLPEDDASQRAAAVTSER
jgi:hypothetical protein